MVQDDPNARAQLLNALHRALSEHEAGPRREAEQFVHDTMSRQPWSFLRWVLEYPSPCSSVSSQDPETPQDIVTRNLECATALRSFYDNVWKPNMSGQAAQIHEVHSHEFEWMTKCTTPAATHRRRWILQNLLSILLPSIFPPLSLDGAPLPPYSHHTGYHSTHASVLQLVALVAAGFLRDVHLVEGVPINQVVGLSNPTESAAYRAGDVLGILEETWKVVREGKVPLEDPRLFWSAYFLRVIVAQYQSHVAFYRLMFTQVCQKVWHLSFMNLTFLNSVALFPFYANGGGHQLLNSSLLSRPKVDLILLNLKILRRCVPEVLYSHTPVSEKSTPTTESVTSVLCDSAQHESLSYFYDMWHTFLIDYSRCESFNDTTDSVAYQCSKTVNTLISHDSCVRYIPPSHIQRILNTSVLYLSGIQDPPSCAYRRVILKVLEVMRSCFSFHWKAPCHVPVVSDFLQRGSNFVELVRLLMTRFLVLTDDDLALWSLDPEEFMASIDADTLDPNSPEFPEAGMTLDSRAESGSTAIRSSAQDVLMALVDSEAAYAQHLPAMVEEILRNPPRAEVADAVPIQEITHLRLQESALFALGICWYQVHPFLEANSLLCKISEILRSEESPPVTGIHHHGRARSESQMLSLCVQRRALWLLGMWSEVIHDDTTRRAIGISLLELFCNAHADRVMRFTALFSFGQYLEDPQFHPSRHMTARFVLPFLDHLVLLLDNISQYELVARALSILGTAVRTLFSPEYLHSDFLRECPSDTVTSMMWFSRRIVPMLRKRWGDDALRFSAHDTGLDSDQINPRIRQTVLDVVTLCLAKESFVGTDHSMSSFAVDLFLRILQPRSVTGTVHDMMWLQDYAAKMMLQGVVHCSDIFLEKWLSAWGQHVCPLIIQVSLVDGLEDMLRSTFVLFLRSPKDVLTQLFRDNNGHLLSGMATPSAAPAFVAFVHGLLSLVKDSRRERLFLAARTLDVLITLWSFEFRARITENSNDQALFTRFMGTVLDSLMQTVLETDEADHEAVTDIVPSLLPLITRVILIIKKVQNIVMPEHQNAMCRLLQSISAHCAHFAEIVLIVSDYMSDGYFKSFTLWATRSIVAFSSSSSHESTLQSAIGSCQASLGMALEDTAIAFGATPPVMEPPLETQIVSHIAKGFHLFGHVDEHILFNNLVVGARALHAYDQQLIAPLCGIPKNAWQ